MAIKFKQIKRWIRGLVKNDDIKNRISDNALQLIENLDIDITGKLTRRWGYEEWEHFQALLDEYPEVTKIQNIYQYIDVGGDKRIFIVANGFVYMQYKDLEGNLQWRKINKDQFFEVDGRIAITTYFDRVFYNDTGSNVWVYDVQNQSFNGYYVEFTGKYIYFYNIQTFDRDTTLTIEIDPASPSQVGQQLYADIIAGLGIGSITMDVNWFERDQKGNYFILNLGATSSTSKYLFKIDRNFSFSDALTYSDTAGDKRLMQFGLWEQEIYVWAEQDRVDVINTETFIVEKSISKSWWRFPVDQSGNKISYIHVDADKMYVYSHGVDPAGNIPFYSDLINIETRDGGSDLFVDDFDDYGYTTALHFECETCVNLQSKDDYDGHKDAPIVVSLAKITSEGNKTLNHFVSDWTYRSGKGVTNGWYIGGAMTQTQQKDYLAPLSSFFDLFNFATTLINNWKISTKSENFYKKSSVFDIDISSLNGNFANGFSSVDPDVDKAVAIQSSITDKVIYCKFDGVKQQILLPDVPFTSFVFEIFNDLQTSNYSALVTLDKTSGGMYKTYNDSILWIPLTLRTEGSETVDFDEAFNPIFVYRDLLHFGDRFNSKMYLYSFDINNMRYSLSIKDESTDTNFRMINFLQSALALSYKEGGSTDKNKIYERLANFDQAEIINYGYYINSNVENWETYEEEIIMKRLNTPDAPKYKINIDGGSSLEQGYYRYSMVFVFGNVSPPQRTLMGVQTPVIQIGSTGNFNIEIYDIDLGTFYNSGTADSDVTAIELYRQESSDGINWDELPYLATAITQTGSDQDILDFYDPTGGLPASPSINDSYIASATANGWTTDNIYTWSGSSWIEEVPTSGRIVLNKADSHYYQYTTSWADIGEFVDTYIDTNASADYDPKNYYQETLEGRRFKVNWIDIHKNKLVLINKLDEENGNLLLASGIDNPENIPPDVEHSRPIESGDGDTLVGGVSSRDYYFLFKHARVYAIYGDIITGALLDIDKKVGTSNPHLVAELSGIPYFMNKKGVYRIAGLKVQNIEFERLEDFFNPESDEAINFEYFHKGFAMADRSREEIRFHIPTEENTFNNLTLIYNVRFDYWRVYKYHHAPLDLNDIFDVGTDKRIFLLGSFETQDDGSISSKVFQLVRNNNDANYKIKWKFVTKAFTIGSEAVNKAYKMARITGKYFTDIVLNYIIDGDYRWGDVNIRKNNKIHTADTLIYNGVAREISIDCFGESANRDPIEINELLLGYDNIKRIR